MNIKNIVFDVGDVLVDFCYKNYMRNLGFPEDVVELFTENMIMSNHWNELDMGMINDSTAKEIFKKEIPGHDEEIERFWDNIEYIVEEYDYAEELIRSIKYAGYKVYILSNYPVELSNMHWPKFRFLKYADGKIISGFEKVAKPDIRIYKLLEERYGLKLEECLFVDDRQINIDGAKSAGMKAVLFENLEKLKDDLARYINYG